MASYNAWMSKRIPGRSIHPLLQVLLACAVATGSLAPAPASAATTSRTASIAEALSRAEAALDARDPRAAAAWLQDPLARRDLPAARRAELHWLGTRASFMGGDGEAALRSAAAALAAAREAGDTGLLVELLPDRALLALKLGEFEVAVEDLAAFEALAIEAEEPQLVFEARIASTRLLAERGNADRALERLSALVGEARRVDLRSAYLAVGEVWLAKGDGARAAAAYSTVLQADADCADAYLGRARARWQLQQAAGARSDLAAARAALGRQPSGLRRDLAGQALADLAGEMGASTTAEATMVDDGLGEVRAALAAGRWEDARRAAESAIMRDRNAAPPRATLAEIYLRQGEYGGAANVYASMVGLVGESRYPRVGGTLAQALMGVEVYDVEGFAEDWSTLQPAERAILREAVVGARQRGPLPATAQRLVTVVEAMP